jgi:hypothetical protein
MKVSIVIFAQLISSAPAGFQIQRSLKTGGYNMASSKKQQANHMEIARYPHLLITLFVSVAKVGYAFPSR